MPLSFEISILEYRTAVSPVLPGYRSYRFVFRIEAVRNEYREASRSRADSSGFYEPHKRASAAVR